MSEHIVKIIPKDPYFHITEQKAQEINNYLKEKITADTIEIMMSKNLFLLIVEQICKAFRVLCAKNYLALIGGEKLWIKHIKIILQI